MGTSTAGRHARFIGKSGDRESSGRKDYSTIGLCAGRDDAIDIEAIESEWRNAGEISIE